MNNKICEPYDVEDVWVSEDNAIEIRMCIISKTHSRKRGKSKFDNNNKKTNKQKKYDYDRIKGQTKEIRLWDRIEGNLHLVKRKRKWYNLLAIIRWLARRRNTTRSDSRGRSTAWPNLRWNSRLRCYCRGPGRCCRTRLCKRWRTGRHRCRCVRRNWRCCIVLTRKGTRSRDVIWSPGLHRWIPWWYLTGRYWSCSTVLAPSVHWSRLWIMPHRWSTRDTRSLLCCKQTSIWNCIITTFITVGLQKHANMTGDI